MRSPAVLLALLLLPSLLGAEEAPAAPEAEKLRQEAQAAVLQLGDSAYEKREAASKRLLELGEPILDLLQNALAKALDPEVRERLQRLLEEIPLQRAFCRVKPLLPEGVSSLEDLSKLKTGAALRRILRSEKGERLDAAATGLMAIEHLGAKDLEAFGKALARRIVDTKHDSLEPRPREELLKQLKQEILNDEMPDPPTVTNVQVLTIAGIRQVLADLVENAAPPRFPAGTLAVGLIETLPGEEDEDPIYWLLLIREEGAWRICGLLALTE